MNKQIPPTLAGSLTPCCLSRQNALLTATCSDISAVLSKFTKWHLTVLCICFPSIIVGCGIPWTTAVRFRPNATSLYFCTITCPRLIWSMACPTLISEHLVAGSVTFAFPQGPMFLRLYPFSLGPIFFFGSTPSLLLSLVSSPLWGSTYTVLRKTCAHSPSVLLLSTIFGHQRLRQ